MVEFSYTEVSMKGGQVRLTKRAAPHDWGELMLRAADMMDIFTREATLGARSWNEAERTLETVFSTGADVERADQRGPYIERLSLAQDWTPFVGAPVLNSHKRGDLADVLGSVVSAVTVGSEARAVIRLSQRAEPIVADIKAGHLRAVSVGYRVDQWTNSTEGGRRVRTAMRWTPVELSIVPIAADPQATIRGSNMDPQATYTQTADPPTTIQDRAPINQEIRSIARLAGLPQSWVDTQIDGNVLVADARAAAFEVMKLRSAAAGSICTATASVGGFDASDPEWRKRTIGEAVYCRMNGTKPSDAARPFVEMSLTEIAKDCLRLRGLSTSGNAGAVMERAFMSTSDLPLILGDSVNRSMRQAYEAVPSALKRIAQQRTARDFRTLHRLQLSSAPTLLPVNEDGEFHAGSVADSEETFRLATYGRIIGFSRAAFVNDDLGALSDITRRMGVASANFEAQTLVNVLEGNAAMKDGYNVFDTTHHANLAATGAVMTGPVLSAARLALRSQTEPGGQLVNTTPKYLVVPSAQETNAECIVTAIQARSVADVNVFAFLSLVVEPRLTSSTAWYLSSDPAALPSLIYIYLEGEQGPQVFSEVGFAVDGISFKIRLDFAAGFEDYRGIFKNPGA